MENWWRPVENKWAVKLNYKSFVGLSKVDVWELSMYEWVRGNVSECWLVLKCKKY